MLIQVLVRNLLEKVNHRDYYFEPSKRRRRRTTPTYNVLNMISTLPTFAPTPQEKQQARYFGPQNNPQGKCIY